MARIRTIKPEFPQSESMGRVSRDARLLFIMLWTICDDSGRARGNSRMLASLLFPYDDGEDGHIRTTGSDVDRWLAELEQEQCIVRYQVDGAAYIQICKWLNHQKIDKPSASKLPEFSESSRILANPREPSATDLDLGSRNGSRNGSRKGMDQDQDQDQDQDKDPETKPQARNARSNESVHAQEFESVWALYPRRPGASKANSLKAYLARRKAGSTAEEIQSGVMRYAKFIDESRTEPHFIKHPDTFFGPGMHFLSDWTISTPKSNARAPNPNARIEAGMETVKRAKAMLFGDSDEG